MPLESKSRPRLQFGLRHIFLWMFALAGAFTLGRIKEEYEPYLVDGGQLLLLLAIVVLGVGTGGFSGHAIACKAGAIIGAVLGTAVIFAAFILSVTLN